MPHRVDDMYSVTVFDQGGREIQNRLQLRWARAIGIALLSRIPWGKARILVAPSSPTGSCRGPCGLVRSFHSEREQYVAGCAS